MKRKGSNFNFLMTSDKDRSKQVAKTTRFLAWGPLERPLIEDFKGKLRPNLPRNGQIGVKYLTFMHLLGIHKIKNDDYFGILNSPRSTQVANTSKSWSE